MEGRMRRVVGIHGWLALAGIVGIGLGLRLQASVAAGGPAAAMQGQISGIALSPASPVLPGTTVTITVNGSGPCGAVALNFGDGSGQTFPISGLPFSQAHAYANAGTFTITASGQGNCQGSQTTALVVRNGTVQSLSASPASPNVASPVTFTVSGTTPCPSIRLAFGDGATATVNATSLPVQQTHAYAAAGSFTASADGQSGCGGHATTSVTVAAPAPPPPSPTPTPPPAGQPGPRPTPPLAANLRVLQPPPELSIDTAGLPRAASVGQQVSYPLGIRNTGSLPANGVGVRMFLPKQVDYVRVDSAQVTGCTVAHPTADTAIVNCTAAEIAAGGTANLTLVVKPINGLVDGDQISFTFQVDPSNAIAESNEGNNVATATTSLAAPSDLELTIVSVTHLNVSTNSAVCTASLANLAVRVRVTNHGAGQSRPTTVRMDWAPGVAPDSSNCPPGTTCSNGSCVVRPGATDRPPFASCAINFVFPGSAQECEFHVSAPGNLSEFGTATVDPNRSDVNDPNRANNSKPIR
jgi:uncharacterized repeat protein (TIGR01451 family)